MTTMLRTLAILLAALSLGAGTGLAQSPPAGMQMPGGGTVDAQPAGTVPWQLLQQAKTVQKPDKKYGPVFTREIRKLANGNYLAPHLLAFLSGMEVWILTATMLVSWLLFRGWKGLMSQPLVLTCILATILMAFVFTYQINLGTMVRARIQFFPALVAFAAAPGLVSRAAQFRAQRGGHNRHWPTVGSVRASQAMSLSRQIRT
jgi:hypothetical protein